MNEEQECIVKSLQDAVNLVYQEERFLLRFAQGHKEGLEQAFVFRIGVHLSNLMKESSHATLDLDSEYNKKHGNAKTSEGFPNGLRPDLIIHKRDSDEENKLVVEFKGWWNNDIESDIQKLVDITNLNGGYHYLVGVFVQIGIEKATYRYFMNGAEFVKS